jgi:DNA replication protein DnaC
MEELNGLLTKLKMDHLEAQMDTLCEQAAQRELDYQSFLVEALRAEWQGRSQRGTETRLRLARFPWVKTLEQFDFDFQPSLDHRQVRELAGMSFVERAHNVVVLGPPGVGKTHLAVALGVKAVEAGHSVLFHTLETLMTRLTRAQRENRLEVTLKQLTYPRLLILDELGYLPLSQTEASLFFRRWYAARARQPHRHQQQELSRLGRGLQRPRPGHRHPRPAAASLHHAQHQGRELPPQGEAPRRAAE